MMPLSCPRCAGVTLEFHSSAAFHACPSCGGEWWDDTGGLSTSKLWQDEQRHKKMLSKPGGSRGSGGKRRHKKPVPFTPGYRT